MRVGRPLSIHDSRCYYLLASMEIALAVSFLLLLALTFLATVDMAFGQLSDVGLRRLVAEARRTSESALRSAAQRDS